MLEKDFNNIVTKSLNANTYGYKIPDTFVSNSFTRAIAPCDVIGLYKYANIGYPVYIESKSLNKPQAFNFNRLENHQIDFLLKVYNTLGDKGLSLFLICVDFGRNDKRVFYWKNEDLIKINERKINGDNILKKEFESLTNYITIKKGLIDFSKLFE